MNNRKTYAMIDCDALAHNLKCIKKKTSKALIAVLKANAYGHGDLPVAEIAMREGCIMVAVSSLDEAIALRNQGFQDEILILGYVDPKDFDEAKKAHVTVSVISFDWIKELLVLHKDLSGMSFHIKIDSGMNRIGLKLQEEINTTIQLIEDHQGIVEGIFSHYACADEDSKDMCEKQFDFFKKIVLETHHAFKWIHIENSAAVVSYEDDFTNAARIGLVMYGISPVECSLDVNPVLSLVSHISCIKKVHQGETIGYGATYTANKECIIATLPIGYADGLLRANQSRCVFCDGEYAPIVGRICMDQCMIQLNHWVEVNTPVEIISQRIPLTAMAKDLNTIPYEILCLLSDRITRIFLQNGKEIKRINQRLHH